jgi:hypothetical protein
VGRHALVAQEHRRPKARLEVLLPQRFALGQLVDERAGEVECLARLALADDESARPEGVAQAHEPSRPCACGKPLLQQHDGEVARGALDRGGSEGRMLDGRLEIPMAHDLDLAVRGRAGEGGDAERGMEVLVLGELPRRLLGSCSREVADGEWRTRREA